MSSLNKASELNFKTYLNEISANSLSVENGTVSLNGLDIAANGDITINGAATINGDTIINAEFAVTDNAHITGELLLNDRLTSLYNQPENGLDLINQPTHYRAYSSVTMAAQEDIRGTGVTPGNIELGPKDNSGMDINLFDFGTNFKLDLDINASPTNSSNFIQIQLIDENDAIIVADYYNQVYTNSVSPAGIAVGPVSAWQLQTGETAQNQLLLNLHLS